MSVTQPYNGLPPQLKIRNTLYYISQNVAANSELGDYSYDLPEPWDDKSESQFNAMVWTDIRPKPTWSDVLSYYVATWNSQYPYIVGLTREDVAWMRQDYIDQYIEEAIEPNIDAKVNKTTTVNGKALSSNISLAYADLTSKPTIPTITTQTHINDAPVNAPTNAETNAPADAPTNLNVLTTLLGTLTGEVNATNGRQNTIAAKVNANAVKQNTIATNVNTGFGRLNAILDALEANSVLAA